MIALCYIHSVDVYVQKQYLDQFFKINLKKNSGLRLKSDIKPTDSFAVGIFDDKNIPTQNLSLFKHKYLIVESDQIDLTVISQIQPDKVFKKSELNRLQDDLQHDYELYQNKAQAAVSEDQTSQIETLQKELNEKSESLKFFANEENLKKNKEKKLLYFLDFLNAEHSKTDFIDQLCQLLWNDFKKMGSFNAMGFIVTAAEGENTFIVYDGKQLKFNYNVSFDDKKPEPSQLANILQRPLASTKFWSFHKNELKSYFFLENKSVLLQPEQIEAYVSERLGLMMVMIQRHISRLQTSYLLNKWQIFGKAYQNPMHVVDSEFNLVQSNYFDQSKKVKCFEKLAQRQIPCENCPVVQHRTHSFVTINQQKYKSYATKFQTDQNYFFVFYDDQTESDLLKSKMIQNEKMNVIGQLANHLAHELNNPLTGLKLATEFILQQSLLENSVRTDFTEVLKGIDRCKNIINDLLDFSSDKTPTLEIATIDEVIKKTMPLLKSITRNHSIFTDVKSVPVKMHTGNVQQVIFNLIKNSCQAIPEKGLIKIYDIDQKSHYDVVFEDNGSGLPESIKTHLFQPFATTKAIGEGTGLGLYISKSLMNRMNADLIYDSTYKSGTRFILRFLK